jgi:23S rRNA (pseudouridine1915-N3)-methyltransferase
MRLRLIVVGRGAPELAAYESRFIKRLDGFQLVEVPEGRARQTAQRQQEEERHIRQQLNGQPYTLFDERGKNLGSIDWADVFARQHGSATLSFVIGGADGVNKEVRDGAEQCWSLSPLTLPHQLARVLAIEQFYRALSINQGHPYHRP